MGPMNKWLNFGGDPDHRLDTGIVFQIRHYWEIRKVVNGHSFILIRHMMVLVRRALAKVCTVPVLLVVGLVVSASAGGCEYSSVEKHSLLRGSFC